MSSFNKTTKTDQCFLLTSSTDNSVLSKPKSQELPVESNKSNIFIIFIFYYNSSWFNFIFSYTELSFESSDPLYNNFKQLQ